ncbi:MAG: DUF2007 domain-containing protein [Acidobacteria bacterium]|nr:DUF2007 domain-containing protein [Acidobacteriota bacterium]
MSDSPYELQRLVTIGTFSTPWEAQIAQARLSAEGLHSLIANEHVIRLVALSNAVGGIQLKVRERDVEAAAAVLRRLAPLPEIYLAAGKDGAPPPTPPLPPAPAADPIEAGASCPSCGGGELRVERTSRLVLGVLPISRRGYRCEDCGTLWRAEEIGGGHPEAVAMPAAADASAEGEDGSLFTVARFHTPWEAHLARTFLESLGLRCCVLEERLPAVHLLSAEPAAYNRLEVHQADAAHAAEILARAWSHSSLVAVPDPDAGDPTGDPAHEGGEIEDGEHRSRLD